MVGSKKVKAAPKPEKLLTEVELELMNVIWDLGTCTVKDVQSALPESRDLAYTSVATIMKILEQKGVLRSEKKEKAHSYFPALSRADYEMISLRHLTANVFRGDSNSLVMRMLNESDLSQNEIDSIRNILEKRTRP